MKRTVAASFAAIALAASLTACGSSSESTASSQATTEAPASQAAAPSETTSSSAAEETPVPVEDVLTYEAPAGLTAQTDSEGAVALSGADASGSIVAIAIAAVTSSQDAEAAVAALAAAGGLLNGSTQTTTGDVTFTESGPLTVDGETGASFSTQTTLSNGGSQAVRGVYVTHNGVLVQIAYTVTSLSGTAEISDADLQAFLSSITWK